MRELRLRSAVFAKESKARIEWALKTGRWTIVVRGVLGRGPQPPSALDKGRATALITGGVCHGLLAGELLRFDNVKAGSVEVLVPRTFSGRRPGVKRTLAMPSENVLVGQVRCTSAADTLRELADRLDDDRWEQALEYCLRKRLVDVAVVATWTHRRVRRVIKARGGLDVLPTESLLETLAIQLIRKAGLPTPVRQYRVIDPRTGRVVARCDLAWPSLGVFIELDGQQHKDQPVYDARRQTLITAITRWGCGRLTWNDVVIQPEWGFAQVRDLLGCLVP